MVGTWLNCQSVVFCRFRGWVGQCHMEFCRIRRSFFYRADHLFDTIFVQQPWSWLAVRLGVYLDTLTLKKHPSGHPRNFVRIFFKFKCQSQAYKLIFSSPYNFPWHCIIISCLILIDLYLFMVEICNIVVPLKNLDAPKLNNRHFWAPSF